MQAEIIALRHQVIVLHRTQETKRPDLHRADRWLWVWLSQVWSCGCSALIQWSSRKLSWVGIGKDFA